MFSPTYFHTLTYFNFFVLYLYLCKIVIFTFMRNDRSSAETSRASTFCFYFKLFQKTHLLIKRYYKNISRNRKENNYINYKCDIMNK